MSFPTLLVLRTFSTFAGTPKINTHFKPFFTSGCNMPSSLFTPYLRMEIRKIWTEFKNIRSCFQGMHESSMKFDPILFSHLIIIIIIIIWNVWSQFKQKFDRLSVFQSHCLVIQKLAFAFVVWGIKGLTDSLLILVQVRCLALGPPCLSAFISRQHPQWGRSCRATLCVLSDFC